MSGKSKAKVTGPSGGGASLQLISPAVDVSSSKGMAMAWTWRYENASGEVVTPAGVSAPAAFPSQGDAESWLGETWRELLDAGVARVTLLEGDRAVYGPMSLSAD
jgi:hypothetical protein